MSSSLLGELISLAVTRCCIDHSFFILAVATATENNVGLVSSAVTSCCMHASQLFHSGNRYCKWLALLSASI
jgi:hypothetical protein